MRRPNANEQKTSYEQAKQDAGGCLRFFLVANGAILVLFIMLVVVANCSG